METINYLFAKTVDKSTLTQGFTIPNNDAERLFETMGLQLEHGERTQVKVMFCGKSYYIQLINNAFNKNKYPDHKDIIQFRYDGCKQFLAKIQEVFESTEKIVSEHYALYGSFQKPRLKIPKEEQEKIEISYSSDGYFIFNPKPFQPKKQ